MEKIKKYHRLRWAWTTKMTCGEIATQLTWQSYSHLHVDKVRPQVFVRQSDWNIYADAPVAITCELSAATSQSSPAVPPVNKRRWMSCHVLTSRRARTLACRRRRRRRKSRLIKREKRSEIKINTNRKGDQSEVVGEWGGGVKNADGLCVSGEI